MTAGNFGLLPHHKLKKNLALSIPQSEQILLPQNCIFLVDKLEPFLC